MRSSILIIKSDAQKQMIESDFDSRFHDLNNCEAGFGDCPFIARYQNQNLVVVV